MNAVQNLCIWGNHSPTMVPDLTYTTINGQKVTLDSQWIDHEFTPVV